MIQTLLWCRQQPGARAAEERPEHPSNCGAFAALLESGAVATWRDQDYGGDSSQVQEQLRSVQSIQATGRAFAAILESGSVVTWGDPDFGADSSQVQEQLRSVQSIQATAVLLLPFLNLELL